jgi:hypothetical protein
MPEASLHGIQSAKPWQKVCSRLHVIEAGGGRM